MNTVIKSVVTSDEEALLAIMRLHNNNEPFELDPTFSVGGFYRDKVPAPKWRFDLAPQLPDVKQTDCRRLPFANGAVSSIVCDLPFMFGVHGGGQPRRVRSHAKIPPENQARIVGHTDAEATRLWCPFTRMGENRFTDKQHWQLVRGGATCFGCKCMAWRWLDDDRGYCGLAGGIT